MAINQIGGFNPYAQSIGTQLPSQHIGQQNIQRSQDHPVAPTIVPTDDFQRSNAIATPARPAQGHAVAEAIQQNVTERMAQVHSGTAPEGVDQDLWSVRTKEERSFFVRTGGGAALTYGRGMQAEGMSAMPVARGGRLDIRI